MPATQKHRLLAMETAAGEDALLVKSFSMREQMSQLFQLEMDLRSEDTEVDFDKLIGTNTTLRLELQGGGTRYLNGYISRFVQTAQEKDYAHYRATVVPWLWFLTRTSDCRIFQKKKAPDIIEEVFKAQGFKDYKLKLTGTYREWEYCVQYRETDFNFVSRLMEQEGIYYYFKHAQGTHILVLADGNSSHPTFPGYAEVSFHQEGVGVVNLQGMKQWAITQEVQ